MAVCAAMVFALAQGGPAHATPSAREIGAILTVGSPANVLRDPGTGQVWVATHADPSQLLLIDPLTLSVVDAFTASDQQNYFPSGLAAEAPRSRVWAYGGSVLTEVDAAHPSVVGRYAIPAGPSASYFSRAMDLAAAPGGGILWLANYGDIQRFDTSAKRVTGSASLGGLNPQAVTAAASGSTVYAVATDYTGSAPRSTLVAIDTDSLTKVSSVDLGPGIAWAVTLSADDAQAWVAMSGRPVLQVDTAAMSVVRELPISGASNVAFEPTTGQLWVTTSSGVTSWNAAHQEAAETMPISSAAGVAFSADGTRVFVARFSADTLAVLEPFRPPSPPRDVLVSSTLQGVEVTWTPPELVGAGGVTGYLATATPGGGSCRTGPKATSCTITGLGKGATYSVSVSALSAAGASDALTAPSAIRVPSFPGAPDRVTASRSGDTVTLRWKRPSARAGARATGYVVTSSPGGRSCATTSTICVIRGLAAGGTYVFAVRARGREGVGPARVSAPIRMPVPARVPPPAPKPLQPLS